MRTTKRRNLSSAVVVRRNDVQQIATIFNAMVSKNKTALEENLENERRKYCEERIDAGTPEDERRTIEGTAQAYSDGRRSAVLESLAVDWKISCSDHTDIESQNVNDILNHPNTSGRRVLALRVQSFYGELISGRLSISSTTESANVEYEVSGEDSLVLSNTAKLDELIEGVSTYYSIVHRLPLGVVVIALFVLTMLFFSFGEYLVGIEIHQAIFGPADAKDARVIFSLMFGVPALGAILVLLVRSYLFPAFVFAVNDGEHLQSALTKRRQAIGVTVILGTLVGVSVNFIS